MIESVEEESPTQKSISEELITDVLSFSNEGTHFPLTYKFGPGKTPIIENKNNKKMVSRNVGNSRRKGFR